MILLIFSIDIHKGRILTFFHPTPPIYVLIKNTAQGPGKPCLTWDSAIHHKHLRIYIYKYDGLELKMKSGKNVWPCHFI